jgi:hypothetical protein
MHAVDWSSLPRYHPILVDTRVACFVTQHAQHILLEMVECGALAWVWDLAGDGSPRRELRFWLRELMDPAVVRSLEIGHALELVVGHECLPLIRVSTVTTIMSADRSAVKRLIDAGELSGPLTGNVRWIERDSLIAFLMRRLVTVPMVGRKAVGK